jgi:hypothetical protein
MLGLFVLLAFAFSESPCARHYMHKLRVECMCRLVANCVLFVYIYCCVFGCPGDCANRRLPLDPSTAQVVCFCVWVDFSGRRKSKVMYVSQPRVLFATIIPCSLYVFAVTGGLSWTFGYLDVWIFVWIFGRGCLCSVLFSLVADVDD